MKNTIKLSLLAITLMATGFVSNVVSNIPLPKPEAKAFFIQNVPQGESVIYAGQIGTGNEDYFLITGPGGNYFEPIIQVGPVYNLKKAKLLSMKAFKGSGQKFVTDMGTFDMSLDKQMTFIDTNGKSTDITLISTK